MPTLGETMVTGGGKILLPTTRKRRVSVNIRTIDNGYLLSVNIDNPDAYESVELGISSLPKLLKAITTFLKGDEEKGSDKNGGG